MRFLVPLVWNLIPSLWFQICVILMLCKEYNSVILLKRAKAGVSFSKLKNVSKNLALVQMWKVFENTN